MFFQKNKRNWCLYNARNDKLLKAFSLDELRSITESIETHEYSHWLVWKHGWKQWQPLKSTKELLEYKERSFKKQPPPVPKNIHSVATTIEKFIVRNLEEESQKISCFVLEKIPDLKIEQETEKYIKRAQKRYDMKMRIEIISNDRIFKTDTSDISTGGLKLNEALPLWIKEPFTVKLISTKLKQAVELTGECVKSQDENQRTRIYFTSLGEIKSDDQLETWLESAA